MSSTGRRSRYCRPRTGASSSSDSPRRRTITPTATRIRESASLPQPADGLPPACRLPVHGQRTRGGHDRRGARLRRRLVHGPPAADVRRAHAVADVLPGRERCRARRRVALARLLLLLRRRCAGDRRRLTHRGATQPRAGVGCHRHRAGGRARARLALPQPVRRHPREPRGAALRIVPRDHDRAGPDPGRDYGRRARLLPRRRPSAPLQLGRRARSRRPRCPRPTTPGRVPRRARAGGRSDRTDHRRAARLRATRRSGRGSTAADLPSRAQPRA